MLGFHRLDEPLGQRHRQRARRRRRRARADERQRDDRRQHRESAVDACPAPAPSTIPVRLRAPRRQRRRTAPRRALGSAVNRRNRKLSIGPSWSCAAARLAPPLAGRILRRAAAAGKRGANVDASPAHPRRGSIDMKLAVFKARRPLVAAAAARRAAPRVRAHKGAVIDPQLATAIQPGVDNKESVEKTLGRPTFTGQFTPNDWYYVSRDTDPVRLPQPARDRADRAARPLRPGRQRRLGRAHRQGTGRSIDPAAARPRPWAASAASSTSCSAISARSARRASRRRQPAVTEPRALPRARSFRLSARA